MTATAGNAAATVRWAPPADDGGSPITDYRVHVSDGSVVDTGSTLTSTVVTPLSNGATYTFTVSAINAIGEGPPSAPSNAVMPLPPSPDTVAPPVDNTVATSVFSATQFIYSGDNPIQTGVAGGTIEITRTAVLRGRVLARDGTALPGVTISILDHPEFGQTVSRADGRFDLVVNGGGLLTVSYARDGYLPAQRQVQAPWQDYAALPDLVMIPYDPNVAAVDLAATTPVTVARGSVISDTDGTRQATLLFFAGTRATMTLPDGTTQEITPTMHVRATEYTVGPNGPAAMPAELPADSAYTYAAEYSVDEAVQAHATGVQFSQPIISYLENFLNFPVGTNVPEGYYDRGRGQWVPSQNGLVVKVLSITNGMADLDVDGSGQPAGAAALAALGITDAERQELAALYQPGQSLWRAPVSHFSAWDFNWGFGPPPDATAPCKGTAQCTGPLPGEPDDHPCKQSGSIIECQNQTLGEQLGVTGTPYYLRYGSDRVPGRLFPLQIPLSGASLPADVQGIDLEIDVAGQQVTGSFPPAPNQTYTFSWNGLDAYGRAVQGPQAVTVRIGYVYNGYYQEVPRFGHWGNGFDISVHNPTRKQVTLWQQWTISAAAGGWDARSEGLGGWTLNVHHVYDPVGRVLYLGDGTRRSAGDLTLPPVITTVAGDGSAGYSGDTGATEQPLRRGRGARRQPLRRRRAQRARAPRGARRHDHDRRRHRQRRL